MAEHEYVELKILIQEGDGDTYQVVADTGGSPVRGTLRLPFLLSELAGVVHGVAQTVRGEPGSREAADEPLDDVPTTGQQPIDYGVRLFRSLFHDKVQQLLDTALANNRGRSTGGVRIRLVIDTKGANMAQVAALPWELLAREDDIPLACARETPVVRSLVDIVEHQRDTSRKGPLRVLLISSNPAGTATLDLAAERDSILKEMRRVPGVVVELLDEPTVSELRLHLLEPGNDYHVIHYMGHGGFDAESGAGCLMFPGAEPGQTQRLTGNQLAAILRDEPMTRLVFLNACKTATTTSRTGLDPFSGVAASLLKEVPAVVAMQFPISDTAAISFAVTFYQCVVRGYPVDAAVCEARKTLRLSERSEWVTPVLYMRSPDGMLFGEMEKPDVAVPLQPAPVRSSGGARAPVAAPAGPRFRIVLASPSDRVSNAYNQALSHLQSQGADVTLIPTEHPNGDPLTEREHHDAVVSLAETADLFVHILGESPGVPIDDADGRYYPFEQLKIALLHARSLQLVFLSTFNAANAFPGEYRAFLEDEESRPHDAEQYELVKVDRFKVGEAIIARRDRLLALRTERAARTARDLETKGEGAVTLAYIDVDDDDLGRIGPLRRELRNNHIKTVVADQCANDTPSNPQEADAEFEKNVRESPLYIVVYGANDPDKVLMRALEAKKIMTRLKTPTRIGVFVANEGMEPLDLPPSMPFDERSLEAWIKRGGPAR